MPSMFVIFCSLGVKECPVIKAGKDPGPVTPKFLKTWCFECVGCEIEIEDVP